MLPTLNGDQGPETAPPPLDVVPPLPCPYAGGAAQPFANERGFGWRIHVWMPPIVQEEFRPSEHVIECGHVSGLTVRLFTRRGPVRRCADQVQIF